jgi:hypothetical protein
MKIIIIFIYLLKCHFPFPPVNPSLIKAVDFPQDKYTTIRYILSTSHPPAGAKEGKKNIIVKN